MAADSTSNRKVIKEKPRRFKPGEKQSNRISRSESYLKIKNHRSCHMQPWRVLFTALARDAYGSLPAKVTWR